MMLKHRLWVIVTLFAILSSIAVPAYAQEPVFPDDWYTSRNGFYEQDYNCYEPGCYMDWTSDWATRDYISPPQTMTHGSRGIISYSEKGGCNNGHSWAIDATAWWTVQNGSPISPPRNPKPYSDCRGFFNDPPTVSVSCSPSTVDIYGTATCSASASDPNKDQLSVSWNIGWAGSWSISPTAYDFTPDTYCATVTDGFGGSATSCATVNVNPNKPPVLTLNCSPTTLTPGQSTSCTASATDPDPGNTVTVTLQQYQGTGSISKSFSWTTPGTYSVAATANDGRGGTDSDSVAITVTGGALTVTVSCSPGSVDLTTSPNATASCSASVTGGIAPYTYNWDNGETGSSSTYGPWTSGGKYTATVTVTDSKGSSGGGSGTITVTGGTGLQVSVSCSPSSLTTGQSATCSASVAGGTAPYSYSWSTGGTGSSTAFGPFSSSGSYSASVLVTDSKGQKGSGSGTVTVNGPTCGPGQLVDPVTGQCYTPCEPDPDYRDLTMTLSDTQVRAPGGTVTAFLTTSGSTSSREARASWGETKPFEYTNGKWQAVFIPPPMTADWTITGSARIQQSDGCGGTYGPSTFSSQKKISVIRILLSPVEEHQPPSNDDMTVANMPLNDYLQVCLGSMEPWYCGIDVRLATIYLPDLRQRQEAYLAQLGPQKWRLLVDRIDAALTRAGHLPSGLYLP